MKSISRFIVIILTTCLLSTLIGFNKISAQPVDTDQAKLVAKNFFADRVSRSRIGTIKGISSQNLEMALVHEEKGDLSNSIIQKKGLQAFPVYYIFNVKNKTNPKDKSGFIIISADQRVPAVLGYSFNEEFSENDQALAFKDWMDHYKEQIIYIIQNNLTPDPEISENWKKYSSATESKGTKQLNEITPMLTTKWSQRSYCNNLCPSDADVSCGGSLNQHVPAGCTAVAMAQIMNYHKYPVANNPIPGYEDPLSVYDWPTSPLHGTSVSYGSISSIGVTNYDWGNMRNDINIGLNTTNDPPTTEQINAVSTLIYHCGVAVQMNYGPPKRGSGSGSPLNAFVEYYKYSPNIQEINRSNFLDADWTAKLKTELNNNRPVYYAGYMNDAMEGGHAFVCDGYQDSDPGNLDRFFHFCWGEGGGGGNGYFNLNDLTPGSYDYTYKQWAIIGISPAANSQTCTIKGYVRDGESGSPLPAINILIKGTMIGGTTNSTGNYYINNIPAGVVTVVASIPGYSGSSKTLVTEGGKMYTVNFWSNAVSDADGNSYGAVEIGTQTWMAENLKTTKYSDGTGIPLVTNNSLWPTLTAPGYGWYDNDIANKDIYGALYNWYTVQSGKLCSTGWHLPTDGDWTILSDYLGGPHVAGGKLKEPGTVHWKDPNIGATNDYGFTALPGGYRSPTVGEFGGNFYNIKGLGFWWSSTEASTTNAFVRIMGWDNTSVSPQTASSLTTGCSVRCLKGPLVVPIPGESGAFAYGDIGIEGEEDWYKFFTSATGDYAIQTHGSTDTYMYLYNSDQTTLIAEDNDGAGAGNSKITRNLNANTWYYVKIKGNGNSTGSYSIGVSALPKAPIGNNLTVTYDGLLHKASASGPSGISIAWYDAAKGGNLTTQPTGTNYGSYSAYAEAVDNITGCTSSSRTLVALTISKAGLMVTAKNQSSQYSDPLKTLTYEITGFVNGETSSLVTGSCEISTTASQFSAPGEYPITISIGNLLASNYAFSFASGNYSITCEDANVTFTGTTTVSTSSGNPWLDLLYKIISRLSSTSIASTPGASSGLATVTLRATVQDISETSEAGDDIYPGDIRHSKVRFVIKDGAPLTDWLTPILVVPPDLKTGVVSYDWKVNIGTATQAVYTIGIEVNNEGYYTNNQSDYTTVTIYKPTGDYIAGGGYINPTSSTGTYASDPGLKTNFGFVVTYKINGTNRQGSANIIFRRKVSSVVHTFQIRSNYITSLGVNVSNRSSKTAVFIANASLTDISKPGAPVSIGGNLTLQANMTDKGDPGTKDQISISLWNGSTLLYSSNWNGSSNSEMVLGGGNLVVHSGFSFAQPVAASSTKSTMPYETPEAEFGVKAYPNPFTDQIYFDFQPLTKAKVRLEIYDATGTKRAVVFDNVVVAYDNYHLEYTPKSVSSGILFYRLIIDGKLKFNGKLIHY